MFLDTERWVSKMGWEKILKIDIMNLNHRKAQYLVTLIRYLVDLKGMRTEEEFEEFMGRELTQEQKEMFKVTVENYDEVNRKDTYTFKDIHYTDLQHPLNIYRVFFAKFPTVREVETILERPMTEEERRDYKLLSEKYDENYRERKKSKDVEKLSIFPKKKKKPKPINRKKDKPKPRGPFTDRD